MLKKLLKYDFEDYLKIAIPVYIVGTVLAITSGLVVRGIPEGAIENDIISVFISLYTNLSFFAIIAIGGVTFYYSVYRIYKSVYSKEGYLTHTLPINHHTLLISKILSAFLLSLLSGLVVILLLGFVIVIGSNVTFSEFSYVYDILEFPQIPASFIFVCIITAILSLLFVVLLIIVSMSIGHLTKHRILFSILTYLGINYLVIQPVTTILTFNFIDDVISLFEYGTADNMFNMLTNIFGISSLICLVFSVIFYFISAKILKTKLNLI